MEHGSQTADQHIDHLMAVQHLEQPREIEFHDQGLPTARIFLSCLATRA